MRTVILMPHVPFVAFHADEPAARAARSRSRQRIIVGGLVALGLGLALFPAFLTVISICGVSGCSGGGFGRSTDPTGTRAMLAATGVIAALPLGSYAAFTRNRRLALVAAILAVSITLTTAWAVGADVHGCPRHLTAETCAEDAR